MLKSRTLVDDLVNPNELSDAAAQAPGFLRGTVLRQYLLKQEVVARVQHVIEGYGEGSSSLARKHGFQGGERGGARCAVEGLVADIVGRPGPVVGADEAIAELHEHVFANYNHWARFVGGTPVYSRRYDDSLPPAARVAVLPHEEGGGAEGGGLFGGILGGSVSRADLRRASVSRSREGREGGGGEGEGEGAASPDRPDGAQDGGAEGGGDGSGRRGSSHGGNGGSRGGSRSLSLAAIALSSAAPGADTATRLYELCLWYCIRAEVANLRFMPE
jgi:hypothetical protein